MDILVIGAGLSGLSSAWFLARAGHQVTIVDRAAGQGLETSYANGGLLTPSMADPWNTPGCWRTLLGSIGRNDAALQLRLRALPGLASWGTRFLWHSAPKRHARATAANHRLASDSLDALAAIVAETGFDFAHRRPGTLRLFRDAAAFERAVAAARAWGVDVGAHPLAPTEALALEPGLAAIAATLAGAIHYPTDELGDARLFCAGLAAVLGERGVKFRWNSRVTALERRGTRITAAIIDGARVEADAYLVATASHTPPLLRTVGLKVPVQPAKGYSLTIPVAGDPPVAVPLVDDDLHAVIVPIGNVLRVAGTAEFAGYDRDINPARVANLASLLRRLLPDAPFDMRRATPWCGLRAMSVDGVPIVGPTRLANLHLNTGHGHLGWTMAAGAGRLAADLIDGRMPVIDPAPYAPARFGRGHG
jgi:D-amino-acid dehydrogenase